jgi:hypothetical protein
MSRHSAGTDGRSAHSADVAGGLAQFPFGIEEILFNNTALLKIFRLTLVEICPECRCAEGLLVVRPEHVDLILRRGEHVGVVFLPPAIDELGFAVRARIMKGGAPPILIGPQCCEADKRKNMLL